MEQKNLHCIKPIFFPLTVYKLLLTDIAKINDYTIDLTKQLIKSMEGI